MVVVIIRSIFEAPVWWSGAAVASGGAVQEFAGPVRALESRAGGLRKAAWVAFYPLEVRVLLRLDAGPGRRGGGTVR
ncbi:hypothetical protein [Streptomyces sp. S.PB5]|uniref:hypothetical protein n=1 Tax=Streptomyces sp. S.PB5 TaxID=3020844 RepID=UPI0025B18DA5|nr:hypothetical protein [Streptomyces sp. S.PB5]MDN3029431.1 hypothetical protein [Streptomyces sp. S.PB5]